jgi:hypothetical protein
VVVPVFVGEGVLETVFDGDETDELAEAFDEDDSRSAKGREETKKRRSVAGGRRDTPAEDGEEM